MPKPPSNVHWLPNEIHSTVNVNFGLCAVVSTTDGLEHDNSKHT